MEYRCTHVGASQIGDIANNANAHMAEMAGQGWRLISTSCEGSHRNVLLFWKKDSTEGS